MDSVKQESCTAIDRIGRAMGVFATHRLIDDVGSVTSAIRHFPAEARGVVEQFIAAAHITKGRQARYQLAYDRISANIRPARRGKDSAKDCLILETYLEVVTRLRAGGFTKPVAFLTTNSDDYKAKGLPNRLHPELAARLCQYRDGLLREFSATRFGLFPHRPSASACRACLVVHFRPNAPAASSPPASLRAAPATASPRRPRTPRPLPAVSRSRPGALASKRQHAPARPPRQVPEHLRIPPRIPVRGIVQHDQADAFQAHRVGQLAAAGRALLEHVPGVNHHPHPRAASNARVRIGSICVIPAMHPIPAAPSRNVFALAVNAVKVCSRDPPCTASATSSSPGRARTSELVTERATVQAGSREAVASNPNTRRGRVGR